MLWLWNVATGEGRSFRGRFHDGATVFSSDGRSLVALGFDDDARLYLLVWDPQTGFTRTVSDPSDNGTRSDLKTDDLLMVFTPDGRTVFTKTGDMILRAWDTRTGRSRRTPGIRAFALSRDGRDLATVSSTNAVVIRDLVTNQERPLPSLSAAAARLALSPDGRWLAASSEDSLIRLWDRTSHAWKTLSGSAQKEAEVAFSPDSSTLASFGYDPTLRLWDVASDQSRVLRGHAEPVSSIAFSPDGGTIASASYDRTVRLWPTRGFGQRLLLRPEVTPERTVRRIAFAPRGRTIAWIQDGASIQLWDLDAGTHRAFPPDGTPAAERPSGLRSLVFSPDGASLAAAGRDKLVWVWDVARGTVRRFAGHEFRIWDLAFSPDGSRLASASGRGVRVWDPATGEARALQGHRNESMTVAFSPDGRQVSSGSMAMRREDGQQDLTVRVWETVTGAGRELVGHADTVTDVRFSMDGRWIASGSMDNTIRIWNASTLQIDRVLKGDGSIVQALAFSPDSRWVVSANDGASLRLWSLVTGLNRRLRGREPVFSADSATLAATDDDGNGWLFDTETGEGRVLPDVYTNVAISPDGRLVAAIGKDGAVHLWDDDLPREPAALKARLQKATAYEGRAGDTGAGPNPRQP